MPLCVLSLIFQAALNVDSTRLNMPDKPAMEDGGMVRMGTCGWSDDTLVKYHPQAFICMCEAMSVADPGYAAAARCGRFYPPRVIASGRTHPRTHPISSAVAVRPAVLTSHAILSGRRLEHYSRTNLFRCDPSRPVHAA